MKVYIVTSGTYSDYHIEAVFLTEEKAKAYIDIHGDFDNRNIEEFDADRENLNREIAKYTVFINPENTEVQRDNSCYPPDSIKVHPVFSKTKIGFTITVETDGAERAKEIASERLMQVKAMPYLFPRLKEKCLGFPAYYELYRMAFPDLQLPHKGDYSEKRRVFKNHEQRVKTSKYEARAI